MTRPHLLLLDANIVIEAFCLHLWDKLTESFSITLPSIVVDKEAQYFGHDQSTWPIHLGSLMSTGVIHQVEASAGELAFLYQEFDPVFVQRIDEGEAEALALLMAGKLPEHRFCTGDAPAIKALAMLDLAEQGISLESVLKAVGLGRRLQTQFTDSFFQSCVRQGHEMRIRGEGLDRNSRFRL